MIEQIEIVAKRWEYGEPRRDGHLLFRVTVKVNGIEHSTEFYIYPDDFITNYEQLWNCAGSVLLNTIRNNK